MVERVLPRRGAKVEAKSGFPVTQACPRWSWGTLAFPASGGWLPPQMGEGAPWGQERPGLWSPALGLTGGKQRRMLR